jgi:hypothetical protein
MNRNLPASLIVGLLVLGGCAHAERLADRAEDRIGQRIDRSFPDESGDATSDDPAGQQPPRQAPAGDAVAGGAVAGGSRGPATSAASGAAAGAHAATLFADDFSADRLGEFPRKLEFVSGSWEIVEVRGRRFLRNHGPRNAALRIPLPRDLPDAFRISFDLHTPHSNQTVAVFFVPEGHQRALPGSYIQLGPTRAGLRSSGTGPESLVRAPTLSQAPVPVRIEVEGRSARVFVGSTAIANVPVADIRRTNAILVQNTYSASEAHPILIGNIRVTETAARQQPATPAAPPVSPPEPAPDEAAVQVCVVSPEGQLHYVTATFRPATGDTVIGGRPFAEVHPESDARYAATATWFTADQPILVQTREYVKFGVPRVIAPGQLDHFHPYQGAAVFIERGSPNPPSVIYVAVRPGCIMHPYQPRTVLRPRDG